MIRGYEIVKIEGVKKEASGSPGSFYIQSEKRGIPFFLDNIYNRKNTLYRVISEPSGIESQPGDEDYPWLDLLYLNLVELKVTIKKIKYCSQ